MSANDKQVGGSHYKTNIEPWDAILDWGLGYLDGSAVKYLSRWHKKGGIQDIEKAVHFLQKLIEVENERLRRASNPNDQDQQAATVSPVEPKDRHGQPTFDDAAYREQVIAALRCRNETGYGQPQDIGDIT